MKGPKSLEVSTREENFFARRVEFGEILPRYYALLVVDEPYLCQGGLHLCSAPFNGEGKSVQVGKEHWQNPVCICISSLAKPFSCN